MKPQFIPRNDKRLVTRAIGVKSQSKFKSLLKKLISKMDLRENKGIATFVSFDLQHSGRKFIDLIKGHQPAGVRAARTQLPETVYMLNVSI